MSWEIVTGIIALIGIFGTVATWSAKLSRTLASLQATLEALRATLKELKDNNHESHKEFYKRLDDHDDRLTRLETINKERGKNIPPH